MRFPITRVRRNWLPILILVVHLLLGVLYSVTVPLWEAHDEWAHYDYIDYLVTHRSLPKPGARTVPEGEYDELTQPPTYYLSSYELTQPPLYYLLGALTTFWVNTGDGLEPVRNPHVGTGMGQGGVNIFIHSEKEAFPYRGTVLAAHLARLLSVLISTLGVWLTFLLGILIFPDRKEIALGAMAIHAFSPQFLFMGSVINNDILVATLSSLILFLCVKVVIAKPKLQDLGFLGLSLGLALLSKYNALALLPLGLVCGGAGTIRQMKARKSWRFLLVGILFLLSLAGVSAWWFFRSLLLYGSLTTRKVRPVARLLEGLRQPLSLITKLHWEVIPGALRHGFITFWASLAWGNVRVAGWIYQVLALFCVMSVIGLVIFLLRRAPASGKLACLILVAAVLLVVATAMYPKLLHGDIILRGRYLLPAISAIDFLIFLGMAQAVPKRFAGGLALLVGGVMFIWSLLTPFSSILPAYAKPPLLSEAELENSSNPLHVNFGNKMELVGYELEREEIVAGQAVRVTLYWRCLAEMDENYTVAVHILGPNHQAYGKQDNYPGRGNYATSLWKRGEIIKDRYLIGTSRRFPAPAFGQLKVALHLHHSAEHLPVLGTAAEPLGDSIIFGRFKVAPREILEPTIASPTYYRFGDVLALIGYDIEPLGGGLTVRLYWQSLKETDRDYTVFLHLVDPEGKVWGQQDGQPRGGYYPTSLWGVDELVEDLHLVPVSRGTPGGEYRLLLGLYLSETMERLPVFDEEGTRLLHDQIVISGVTVER
jgi:4-amino-4-deoxy-L-arabinose transferase-like glycosyltransferase